MSANVNTLSANARALWNNVQTTLGQLGFETTLTSAGRSASENSALPNASKSSDHLLGNAFDFITTDSAGRLVDPLRVQATLAASGIQYGQSIAEYKSSGAINANHLSVANDRHNMQTLIGRGSKYSPNIIAASARSSANEAIASAMKSMGLSDDYAHRISDSVSGTMVGIGEALQAPGQYIADTFDLEGWIKRGAIAIVALILIMAAVFALSKVNPVSLAAKVVP